MTKLTSLMLPGLLLGLIGSANVAADQLHSSRSAGKLTADTSVDLAQEILQSPVVTRSIADSAENYAARAGSQANAGLANRHDQLFEIFSADVATISDLDGDGFHHALKVYFDVDVSVASATIYAKLYLSREGGPWSQYFTTDLFAIHVDDSVDAYEVETELLEGYRAGYYDVLIEIYSLDHAFMVASEVLDYHYLGRDLMIEDLARDEPYEQVRVEYYEESHHSGGGSIDLLLLFLLIVQVVIAARESLALPRLSPRNDGDHNDKNETP